MATSKDELEQQLNAANAKLAAQIPDKPEIKRPYNRSEIEAFAKEGHVVGKADQQLVTGHNIADLQKWDLVRCEMKIRLATVPEINKEWTIPVSITPLKVERPNLRGNDKTFQNMNKQVDFRYRREDMLFYYLPSGSYEFSKTYEAGYWIEVLEKGRAGETKHVRLDVKDIPRVTGTPKGN